MRDVILKWAYRHLQMAVDEFDTLEAALSAAQWASEERTETLVAIEVISESGSRIISGEECWQLVEDYRQPSAPPSPEWFRVEVKAPDGTWALFVETTTKGEADEAAEWLSLLSRDRVRIVHRTI